MLFQAISNVLSLSLFSVEYTVYSLAVNVFFHCMRELANTWCRSYYKEITTYPYADFALQRPVLDPQLSVVSNPDISMDLDDDQAQDLSMTSLRTSQSELDFRDLRAMRSSDIMSDSSPPSSTHQPTW